VTYEFIKKQKNYSDYNRELVRGMGRYLNLSEKNIEEGIQKTRLPCRFETVEQRPLVILDGAHNRAKILSTISNLNKYKFKKLYLLLAIADNKKDHRAILKPLLSLPYKMEIIFTQIKGRSVYPDLLLSLSEKYMKKSDIVRVVTSPNLALAEFLSKASKEDLVLVTGSFFLAGELRKRWVSEEWILKNRKSFKK
jgi:dihydrofolate synthase/folylpolyglutamate synthase